MTFGRVVQPSSVHGTVEWSYNEPADIALDIGEVKAKEMKV